MALLLFKASEDTSRRIRQADNLAAVVDTEYHALTGKPNRMRNGNPVAVVEIDGGYWYLRFNDREFSDAQKLRDMVKRWENAPFMS